MPQLRLGRALTALQTLSIQSQHAKAINATHGEQVALRFGSRCIPVTVTVMPQSNGKRINALLSADACEQLLVPTPIRIHLKREADGSLRLGPLIGVLAQGHRSLRQPFFNQTPYFAALVTMGRRHGIPTYVFRPRDINWETQTVRAWVRSPRRVWRRATLPLPDVVYDRVQSRRLDLLRSTRDAKRRLNEMKTPMFNTGFLDKWDTYAMLSRAEATAQYLPDTQLVTDRDDVVRFARRYRSIFVKPAGGSLGQGIMVLRRRANGRFNMVHYSNRGVFRFRNVTLWPLWNRLRRFKRRRRYVVQQGLSLVRYRGRRFDIRVLVQKGHDGNWQISALYARVAVPGSLRSNLDAGGKAINGPRILRRIYGRTAGRRVLGRIQQAALDVAKTLEAEMDGPLGELGLDIGVDRRGRPWVIEANAKPLRQMEGPRRRLALSILRPLRFAQSLANF